MFRIPKPRNSDARTIKYASLLTALLQAMIFLSACALQPVPEIATFETQVPSPSPPAATATPNLTPPAQPTATPSPVATVAPRPPNVNIALTGAGRSSEGGESAHLAFDGDPNTNWNAKNFAAQWIAVTLDALYLVDRIALVVAQTPPGPTTHVLWLGNGSGARGLYTRLEDIQTEDGQTIEVLLDPPQPVDELLVHTLESPSWVGWREVQVFGAPAPEAAESSHSPQLGMEKVIENLELPVQVTHAGDGSNRIFVVEQHGRIRVFKDGLETEEPFIDISGRVWCCGERGLINIAFSPDFQNNRQFYLSYTNLDGSLVVSRFTAAPDLETGDPDSEEQLLAVSQPHHAHNGGRLSFGPLDGYLYVGIGDGGSEDLPPHTSQDPDLMLGKILRIDVESLESPYGIPANNPFVDVEGFRPEIWALGLRNPWGFAFDPETGDLYLPDTGHSKREEVNFVPASSLGGENYGWPTIEGTRCLKISGMPVPCHQASIFTLPVAEYDHTQGCAVVGGVVYRGSELTQLDGKFLFADFCRGNIWSLHNPSSSEEQGPVKVSLDGWRLELALKAYQIVSSIGEDEEGNLYVVAYQPGALFKLSPK